MKKRKPHPIAAALCGEAEFESAGVWTRDFEQMRGKLAAYQLPDAAAWAGKALQAAVSMGSPRLDARTSRSGIELSWTSEVALDGSELLHGLQAPVLRQNHPVDYVAAALRGAGAQGDLELATPQWRVLISGGETTFAPCRGSQYRLVLRRSGAWSWLKWLRARLPQALSELRWLQERGQFAPLQLSIDGRPCAPRLTPEAPVKKGLVRPRNGDFVALEILLFGRDAEENDQLAVPRTRGAHRALAGSRHYYGSDFARCNAALVREVALSVENLRLLGASERITGERSPLLGVIRIPCRSTAPSHLTIVRQGLMCEAVEVQFACPGVQAFLAAPKCELDLSQFRPVDNDVVARMLQMLRRTVKYALNEAEQDFVCLDPGFRPLRVKENVVTAAPAGKSPRAPKVIKPRKTR